MIGRKWFFEFIGGTIFSIIGFLLVITLYKLFRLDLSFAGDRSQFLLALFIGMPIGNVVGIFMVDKRVLAIKDGNVLGFILAFIINLCGIFLSIVALDKIGGAMFPVFWLVIILLSVLGNNIFPVKKRHQD